MKKDKAWLKEELMGLKYSINEFGKVRLREVLELIDQLDEPEVEQLDKKISELESYNDELIRDNNQLRNELDNQEVLSKKWIGEHKYNHYIGKPFVYVDDLQNLLVPKQDKPVIPKFVADYIELNKGWSKDRQEYVEDDSNGLWFALNGDSQGMPNSVSDWLFNKEKVETFAKAWLDGYTIEKERQWVVKDDTGYLSYLQFSIPNIYERETSLDKNGAYKFNSKSKADLIADLVTGTVEEVKE